MSTIDDLSTEVLFDVLASRRRRYVLHYLRDCEEAVTFEDLVGRVARAETDGDPTETDRRDVRISLHHVHLPKLEDAGLVECPPDRSTVGLTDRVAVDPPYVTGIES